MPESVVDVPRRPSTLALVVDQVRYALTDLLRTPVATFFTVAFPLIWLGSIVLVTGNPVVDEQTGLRLTQFMTGPAIAFATVMSCFSSMPVTVALARDRRVLKRLHGTPLPAWTYVAGRVIAAAVVSVAAAVLVLVVAVAVFDVDVVWRTLPASLVTLLVGVACFAALGLGVVAVARSATVVQAVTPALLISLAFVSGLFVDTAALPTWLRRVGQALPLEPFAAALTAQLYPFRTDSGWYLADLAVMAAWGALGAVVAVRWFRWEPRHPQSGDVADRPPRPAARVPRQAGRTAIQRRRPSSARLLRVQTGYAVRELWRDRTSTFFAIGLPVLLLVLVSGLADAQARQQGMPLPQYLTGALAAYGVFVTAYTTLPERVATAQESGALKRLLGTPLPFGFYLAGRLLAVVALAALTLLVLVVVGVVFLGVETDVATLPAVVLTLLLGAGCAAALGLALAAAVRPAKAVPAVALGTLLPLAFISDIFILGAAPPQWVQDLASVFPLKHFASALAAALDPATPGLGLQAGSLAVLAAWTAAGTLVSWWLFRRPERAPRGRAERPQGALASSA